MKNTDSKEWLFPSKSENKKKTLLSRVLILTVANILVKICGFFYKVPLNVLLGDEMANVNTAYAIYATLFVISSAGIPSAVSVIVSKNIALKRNRYVNRVFRVSLLSLSFIGLLLCILLLVFAKTIARINSGGNSYYCMLAIAPSLFFVCISSVFRGYFQGFRLMLPTAVSQVTESFFKTMFGLLFGYIAYVRLGSAESGAAFSVLGISCGMLIGMLVLPIFYYRYKKRGLLFIEDVGEVFSSGKALSEVFKTALPIALSSLAISISGLIDSQFMRTLLERYYNDSALAKAIYSDYSTGAVTLFNLPGIFIYPIACAMIPYISSALAENNKEKVKGLSASSVKIASLFSLPAAVGMGVMASPLLEFVFRGDADMAKNAGFLLSWLSPSVFFIGLLAVTNSLLQAHSLERKPIISMALGLLVKFLVMPILVLKIGASGVPISTGLFYLTALCVNFMYVFGVVPQKKGLFCAVFAPAMPAFIASLGALGVYLAFCGFGNTPALLFAAVFAVIIYVLLVLLMGLITKEDIEKMPKGERIVCLFDRLISVKNHDGKRS